ncbi:MAG: GntR family transcriptional regulator [Kordiimonadaceae bacterium]|nr:GntR family transcriptional regulator [Kordiimonadaceae bacterium]
MQQIRYAVQEGGLKSGHSLPPVRQLAGDLMINPNTVAKAYKLLESQKVIRGAGRKGTFIEDNAAVHIERSNQADARYELGQLVKTFEGRGMTVKEIRLLLFNHIEKLRG